MNRIGRKSQSESIGVHPLLAACAWMTIMDLFDYGYDATIFDGLRTLAEQRNYYSRGTSKTMKSNHLTGKSVDIVPYVDGQVRWDDVHNAARQKLIDDVFDKINERMKANATVLGITVKNLYDRVGWDKPHWDIIDNQYDVRKLNMPIR